MRGKLEPREPVSIHAPHAGRDTVGQVRKFNNVLFQLGLRQGTPAGSAEDRHRDYRTWFVDLEEGLRQEGAADFVDPLCRNDGIVG